MILEAFALLLPSPVHEEAVVHVHRRDRDHHIADDAERGNAAEQADDQAQPAEELGTDGQKCQRRRNAHLLREEAHGAVEAVASEPAQHLLRAVCEEHDAQHQAQNGECEVVGSGKYLAQLVLLRERPLLTANPPTFGPVQKMLVATRKSQDYFEPSRARRLVPQVRGLLLDANLGAR